MAAEEEALAEESAPSTDELARALREARVFKAGEQSREAVWPTTAASPSLGDKHLFLNRPWRRMSLAAAAAAASSSASAAAASLPLAGKRGAVFGFASHRSLAFAVAEAWVRGGAASVSIGIQTARFAPALARATRDWALRPHVVECDLASDASVERAFAEIAAHHGAGGLQMLAHSAAHAPSAALRGAFVDTARADFAAAHDASAYSLVALARGALPLMALGGQGGSIVALSFLGAARAVPAYKVMGPAKASLEASARARRRARRAARARKRNLAGARRHARRARHPGLSCAARRCRRARAARAAGRPPLPRGAGRRRARCLPRLRRCRRHHGPDAVRGRGRVGNGVTEAGARGPRRRVRA